MPSLPTQVIQPTGTSGRDSRATCARSEPLGSVLYSRTTTRDPCSSTPVSGLSISALIRILSAVTAVYVIGFGGSWGVLSARCAAGERFLGDDDADEPLAGRSRVETSLLRKVTLFDGECAEPFLMEAVVVTLLLVMLL